MLINSKDRPRINNRKGNDIYDGGGNLQKLTLYKSKRNSPSSCLKYIKKDLFHSQNIENVPPKFFFHLTLFIFFLWEKVEHVLCLVQEVKRLPKNAPYFVFSWSFWLFNPTLYIFSVCGVYSYCFIMPYYF